MSTTTVQPHTCPACHGVHNHAALAAAERDAALAAAERDAALAQVEELAAALRDAGGPTHTNSCISFSLSQGHPCECHYDERLKAYKAALARTPAALARRQAMEAVVEAAREVNREAFVQCSEFQALDDALAVLDQLDK